MTLLYFNTMNGYRSIPSQRSEPSKKSISLQSFTHNSPSTSISSEQLPKSDDSPSKKVISVGKGQFVIVNK